MSNTIKSEGYKKLLDCKEQIREKTAVIPKAAIVLGSGLGGYADQMKVEAEVAYSEIEGFPVSTVAGHDGRFLFGYIEGFPVVMMKGRVHYYEGYDISDVVLPIRLMGMLGAKILILTNAAGGVNLDFQPGDLMMIEDHISIAVPNPLRGKNMEELGVRFPDMSQVYDRSLCHIIEKIASEQQIDLKKGVYIQCSGPSYETPAEIRMFRKLGIDAVGMSTVCEAIAANHMGMRVCGISCITNMAAGILDQPLNHKEVQEAADRVKDQFEQLVTGVIGKIKEI